ncbi:hypothetical protein P3S68_028479 [Capsicum galapagoense]
MEADGRWTLQGNTTIVTGGTRGIGQMFIRVHVTKWSLRNVFDNGKLKVLKWEGLFVIYYQDLNGKTLWTTLAVISMEKSTFLPSPSRSTPKQAHFASPSAIVDPTWYFNSGATHHVTSDMANLSLQPYTGNDGLAVGNVIIMKLLRGIRDDDLYCLQLLSPHSQSSLHSVFLGECTSLVGWHRRLAHPNETFFWRLVSNFKLPISIFDFPNVCEPCQLGKSRCLPFSHSHVSSSSPFQLVYSDIWGPSPFI